MCDVKNRLIQFIDYKQLSKNKFEQLCGLSSRYVSNISKSIQPEKVKKISLVFPELNTGWLMTGEGNMLKMEDQGIQSQTIGTNNGTAINGHHIEVEKGLDKYYDQLSELIEQNSRLIRIIENLTDRKSN